MTFPTPRDIQLYERQLRLADLGLEGQRRLREARVLVMGGGGLGVPASVYLAAAGVGALRLAEGDAVERSNLHRQPVYDDADCGGAKGAAWRDYMRAHFPDTDCTWTGEPFSEGSAARDLVGVTLVLDCADSLAATFLLHDAALARGIPLVSAALHAWEIQLASFVPGHDGGCLRCLWPEQPADECATACADTGILGAVAGVAGSLQALEAIRLICGMDGDLASRQLHLDLHDYGMHTLARRRQPDCIFCDGLQRPAAPPPVVRAGSLEVLSGDPELSAFRDYLVVDLRERNEPGGPLPDGLPDTLHLPLSELRLPHPALDPARPTLLVCAHGVRSLYVAASLRANGFADVWSLRSGVDGLGER